MRMQPAGGIRMSKAWNKKSAPHGYRDEAKRNRDERKDWLESAYERNFTNAYAEMPGMQEVSQKPEKTHIRCHICQVLPCVGLPRM